MSQMSVSVTSQLAGYVRRKVKSGRYNNASEVVRDALRRMEEEERRSLRVAKPAAEDLVADLTQTQVELIRARVLEGLADFRAGNCTVYEGREGLKQLAEQVKAQGRQLIRDRAKK